MAKLADALWLIHTKNGETFTSKTHYPWDVPVEDITSVERIIGGKSVAIKAHPSLHDFFVKSDASIDFVMVGKNPGARPTEIDARIIGCHIGEPPNVHRIELQCDSKTGNVMLVVKDVEKATKDGF